MLLHHPKFFCLNLAIILLLSFSTTKSISAQCSLYIDGPSIICASSHELSISISGTCPNAETYHLSVSYDAISQCDDDFYDCSFVIDFEASSTFELMNQVLFSFMPFDPSHNGWLTVELSITDTDGNEVNQDQYTPSIEGDYPYLLDSDLCSGSVASVFIPNYANHGIWWWDNAHSYNSETFLLLEDGGERFVLSALDDASFDATAEFQACNNRIYNFDLTEDISTSYTECTSAIELNSGVYHLEENICGPMLAVENECNSSSQVYRTPRWFTINSNDATAVSFGLEMMDAHTPTFGTGFGGRLAIEAYRKNTEDACEDLVYIGCSADFNQVCFTVQDFEAILPNTDYYFKTLLIPTTNVQVAALLSTEGYSVCGCSNTNSCAYSPSPLFTVCPDLGCTDPEACNYSSSAQCDDGTCTYPSTLELFLYQDENYNGTYQSYEDEIGGFGIVNFELDGEVVYSVVPPLSGIIQLPEVPEGNYEISFEDPEGNWQMNSITSATFPSCTNATLGIFPSPEVFDHYSHFIGVNNTDLNCNSGMTLGFWLLNIGSEPLRGTVSITYDESLDVSAYGSAWSDNTNNVATWNIYNHPVGEARFYRLQVAGPDVSLIGQELEFMVDVLLTDDLENIIYEESVTSTSLVTCAYDPNDKTLITPHNQYENYVHEDTEDLTYRIRFQNTGNAPAQNVRIKDNINLEHFDLSSFTPLSSSHDYYTLIDPSGEIEFVFNNIYLPDSSADFEGSQGEVYFRIRLREELQAGDPFENFAEIYFDNNPPIITNTTTNSLFDCDWMTLIENSVSICNGNLSFFYPDFNFVEDYSWSQNGSTIGTSNSPLQILPNEFDSQVFLVHMNNPFCTSTSEVYIENYDNAADLNEDGLINFGDLLIVIGDQGCSPDCLSDLNGNGIVDVDDLLEVLRWMGVACQ